LEGAAKNSRDQASKILRHPAQFITETIKRGENSLAVAQYCGTSLAMIQADYCGTLGLRLDQTFFKPQAENPLKNMVAGPGFEPVPPAASKNLQVLKMNDFKGFRKRKSA
jgi:hypothetical protein